jgi:hypothetical protein
MIPEFGVTEEDRETVVRLEGLRNLRLSGITIDTDSMFMRTVAASQGGGKELYNLMFNDSSISDTTIPFNGQAVRGSGFFITIHNGDDRPINIKGITVRYYADELVFEDDGSEIYTLAFGINSAKAAPVYDISRYKDEILKGDIDRLDITEITLAVKDGEEKQIDYRAVFNVVVIAVALLLGLLIFLKLRKKA